MKKNSYIHIRIKTENLQKLKNESASTGLSLSEFCRQKLLESCKLDNIELMVSMILKKSGGRNENK